MKLIVAGLRHGHIASIVKEMKHYPQIEVVATAEPQPEQCAAYIETAGVKVTHARLADALREVECDAVAVGDVFAERGALAIQALEAGKHVLADKPLCTRPEEMRRIAELSKARRLSVIAALTLRYTAAIQTGKRLLREGCIGQVGTACVRGQHPLNFRSGRPDWYFESGRHGGTIVDLMIHGIDSLWVMTGFPVVEVIAARAWHMEPAEAPFFQDCAQAMFRLANGAGVQMEASYKAVKGHPAPWSLLFNGTEGELYVPTSGPIVLKRPGRPAESIEPALETKGNCVADFLAETVGLEGHTPLLTTADSLASSAKAVAAQAAADARRPYTAV